MPGCREPGSGNLYFLPLLSMSFRNFVRSIIGLPTRCTLNGRPVPASVSGCMPVTVVHDRRLSVGVFSTKRRRGQAPQYRIVSWRTYTDRAKKERATTSLHRDELDPVLRMLEECARRLSVAEVGSERTNGNLWHHGAR